MNKIIDERTGTIKGERENKARKERNEKRHTKKSWARDKEIETEGCLLSRQNKNELRGESKRVSHKRGENARKRDVDKKKRRDKGHR